MASLTDYSTEALMSVMLKNTSQWGTLTTGPAIYIGLSTLATIPEDADSTNVGEVAYTGYQRILTDGTNWISSGGPAGQYWNVAAITWAQPSGGTLPVTANSWFFATVASGVGDIWIATAITPTPLTIDLNVIPTAPANSLTLTPS